MAQYCNVHIFVCVLVCVKYFFLVFLSTFSNELTFFSTFVSNFTFLMIFFSTFLSKMQIKINFLVI